MQQPQGHHLTGPEVRFGMFRDGVQLFIDLIKQRGDQLYGGHGLLRSWQGVTLSTSLEEVHDHYNRILSTIKSLVFNKIILFII
jgi:hypothetical protein